MRFNKLTRKATNWLGSPTAVTMAFGSIIIWAIYGSITGFTSGTQLLANTFTTLVTYAMVFVVLSSQNRDSRAMQLKLDEIIRGLAETRNKAIALEEAEDRELDELKAELRKIRDDDSDN